MASTKSKSSQEVIDGFWKSNLTSTQAPSKVSAILPRNVYAEMVERHACKGVTATASVTASYEESKKTCQAKVAQIVRECRQINQKYTDPYFDLDDRQFCLDRLYVIKKASSEEEEDDSPAPAPVSSLLYPPAVKRVGDIFDNPRFFVEGVSAKDIRQGCDGDCWFLSALATLCSMEPAEGLVERICVARDEEVGVYGFVLYRDGEWISVIVDDKLYLRKPDYEDSDENTRAIWEDNRVRVNSAEEYRKEFQSNSRALWFAQSTHPDETWVPILEKAFAKAHGDYGSIEFGSVGTGVEDLTGGISTTILSEDILSKDKFWTEGLLKVNKDFLFGLATQNWVDPDGSGRDGIHGSHAYSVLRAENYHDERLLMVKNPWGRGEWNGPWSDGSSQWTAESIKDLGHTFGDDGVFWIRYRDLLRKFAIIWRTRLFDHDWQVTQQWMTVAVPWAGEYQDTKFKLVIKQATPTVIVLSQLDGRYFRGLEGQYKFQLSFRLHEAGQEAYIMRTYGEYYGQRSVSVELDLEAGQYEVRLKISAYRNDDADKVEDIVRTNWLERREKLLQVGQSYDLAHAKGQLKETEAEAKPKSPKAEQKDTEQKVAKADTEKGLEISKVVPATTESDASKTEPEAKAVKDTDLIAEADIKGEPPNTASAETSKPELEPGVGNFEPGQGEAETKKDENKVEPKKDGTEPEKDETKQADDAWDAVCVVGLRVFCKGGDATIEIVRPTENVADKPNLDVDDPARDATQDAQPLEIIKEEKEKTDKEQTK